MLLLLILVTIVAIILVVVLKKDEFAFYKLLQLQRVEWPPNTVYKAPYVVFQNLRRWSQPPLPTHIHCHHLLDTQKSPGHRYSIANIELPSLQELFYVNFSISRLDNLAVRVR